ncbi:hypothetical protein B296_00050293 [Ensete ventricosum]|uniref:Uncharacterized protein n=1 Tax=Ensete ventricosum TaxID=4639 RepID=A0A426YLX9_ENSVE|nr:hypothetical protein B296_00050293 [Ensete ventricosum]
MATSRKASSANRSRNPSRSYSTLLLGRQRRRRRRRRIGEDVREVVEEERTEEEEEEGEGRSNEPPTCEWDHRTKRGLLVDEARAGLGQRA